MMRLAALLASLLFVPAQAQALDVVTSIKPVHGLVTSVMGGVGEPALLVEGSGSPHTYALTPKNASALQNADLVFWIGPDLEAFLANALGTLAPQARHVALIDVPDVAHLELREGGAFEAHAHEDEAHEDESHDVHDKDHSDEAHEHEHEHEHEGEEGDAHAHGDGVDQHIWLDPQNALVMLVAIADALAEADPENADRYRANAAEAAKVVLATEAEISERLSPLSGRPFIVFHDGYHYFEHRFGVEAAGAITVNPDAIPGAQRIAEIRDRIGELEAVCVFAEPQFEPRVVRTVTEGSSAKTGELDPLGAEIAAGPGFYPALLNQMADAFVDCLGN